MVSQRIEKSVFSIESVFEEKKNSRRGNKRLRIESDKSRRLRAVFWWKTGRAIISSFVARPHLLERTVRAEQFVTSLLYVNVREASLRVVLASFRRGFNERDGRYKLSFSTPAPSNDNNAVTTMKLSLSISAEFNASNLQNRAEIPRRKG